MRLTVWTVVVWSLCGAGLALAQEKTEAPKSAESQAASQTPPPEAKPTDAAPANPAPAAVPNAPPGATKAEEPVQTEPAKPEKAPAAKAAATRGPCQSSWEEASPDEKALVLAACGGRSK